MLRKIGMCDRKNLIRVPSQPQCGKREAIPYGLLIIGYCCVYQKRPDSLTHLYFFNHCTEQFVSVANSMTPLIHQTYRVTIEMIIFCVYHVSYNLDRI